MEYLGYPSQNCKDEPAFALELKWQYYHFNFKYSF